MAHEFAPPHTQLTPTSADEATRRPRLAAVPAPLPKLGLPTFQLTERAAPFAAPAAPARPHVSTQNTAPHPRRRMFEAPPLMATTQTYAPAPAPATHTYTYTPAAVPPMSAPAPVQTFAPAPASTPSPNAMYAPQPQPQPAAPALRADMRWQLTPTPAVAHAGGAAATLRSRTSSMFSPAEAGTGFTLQPVHVGIAMTLMVLVVLFANNPGSLKTMGPASLPGPATLVPGQQSSAPGVVAGRGMPAATATLPLRRKPTGMMSPAAAASIVVEGGGRAPESQTAAIQMKGIPSPAAAATMGPQTLPLKASDGMTLPRATGERDSAAAERHYGDNPGDAVQTHVERPLMTPAEASRVSELQSTQTAVGGGAYEAPATATPGGAF